MAYVGENPNFKSTILDNKGASSVPNAPSGKTRIINRDGSLFLQDDTGSETAVGTGAGGVNYVLNPNAEINETDDVSATNITLAEETGSPLEATRSFKLTSLAQVGECDWSIDVSDAYVAEAGILSYVTALLKTDSAVAAGDYTVGIYNVTEGEYVGGGQTDLSVDLINVFQDTFVPIAGDTYVIRVEFTDTTAGRVLIIDKLKMTSESSTAIQAFEQKTNTVPLVFSATPAGWSLQNSDAFFFRDSNDEYWMTFSFYADISPTSAPVVTIDGIAPSYNQAVNVTRAPEATGSTHAFIKPSGQVVAYNVTASGNIFRANGTIKLSEKPDQWDANLDDNKINLITPNLLSSNAKAHYRMSGNTGAGDSVTFDFDEEVRSQGGFTDDGAGVITIPADGVYALSVQMRFTTNLNSGGDIAIKQGGVTLCGSALSTGNANDKKYYAHTEAEFLKGQTVRVIASNTTAKTVDNSAGQTFFTISRIADIGAHEPVGFGVVNSQSAGLMLPPSDGTTDAAAGAVGEYLQSPAIGGQALANGVAKTVASLTLTPGDWDLSGVGSGTDVDLNHCFIALRTTPNSVGGVTADDTIGIIALSGTMGGFSGALTIRAKVTVDTIYYLSVQVNGAVGTGVGRITARRAR